MTLGVSWVTHECLWVAEGASVGRLAALLCTWMIFDGDTRSSGVYVGMYVILPVSECKNNAKIRKKGVGTG